MKWQKRFGAGKSTVIQTEKACPKYTSMDSKLSIKKTDNCMKMTVHCSEVSKEKKLLGQTWKTKQKTLCCNINPQCAQISKSKNISGCSILKN